MPVAMLTVGDITDRARVAGLIDTMCQMLIAKLGGGARYDSCCGEIEGFIIQPSEGLPMCILEKLMIGLAIGAAATAAASGALMVLSAMA
jgi:hypothetical protein